MNREEFLILVDDQGTKSDFDMRDDMFHVYLIGTDIYVMCQCGDEISNKIWLTTTFNDSGAIVKVVPHMPFNIKEYVGAISSTSVYRLIATSINSL